MTPTTWTEGGLPVSGWQQGGASPTDASTDYFIDVLFEGTNFFSQDASWAEGTLPGTVFTKGTLPGTPWTEGNV